MRSEFPIDLVDRANLLDGNDVPATGVDDHDFGAFGNLALEKGPFGPDRVTGQVSTVLPEGWWVADRPVTLTGAFDASRRGLRVLELGTSLRPLPDSYVSAATRWNGDHDQLGFSVTFRQVLDGALLNTAAARRPGGTSLTLSADGAVGLGGPGVDFTSRDLQGRAGIVGRVFYDRDGDRIFGPGDEAASDVSVLVGGLRSRTDARGYYRAWSVTPYEITAVAVDTLSGIDPRYTVLSGGTLLRPVPHTANRVDFPLAETRELLGRVETESGAGVGGVEVELVQEETGRRVSVRTFSDGTFYVSRLLPGLWRVAVAQGSLDALQARSDPPVAHLDVDVRDPELLLELAPFVLRDG